ncbi:MAG: glycogen debranching protein GlgX [Bryobacteraceae bacterium]|nr:glycogen debranching protein GlgX [Bryobacteraceae bacterium]
MERGETTLHDKREAERQALQASRGAPLPLGATPQPIGINFAIFSRHATGVTLRIFGPGDHGHGVELALDPRLNRTGDIWHVLVRGLAEGAHYAYRMERTPYSEPRVHRFTPHLDLLDPYAKAVSIQATPHALIPSDTFDWESDQPLNLPLADAVIYELHVRGFTQDPSSATEHPGTFLGLTEKIPYLKELGVNAVELLPVHEFADMRPERVNPLTGERLVNYWGYDPISFFAPKNSYRADPVNTEPVREFKTMVKAFHSAGIEVILDVVFNHTGEGDEFGPTLSFRGIDNVVYYMLDRATCDYLNYSGCGNTLNCNHPVVRDLILCALRYWVTEMHVDGFRFDLASILGRGRDGAVLVNPPLLENLAADPILANTKLIAEAWDAAGLYQVGTFPAWGRWAEWNGRFRDDVRRFVRGDPGMVSVLATRLCGSPDLYQASERQPYHSINFVTCHDGFTLADLVSYNEKHNLANGENNLDGANDNLSWNCGAEGLTDSPEILRLRRRQVKNMATLLLMAHGVPMILAGDELGRTQEGNNNAYCQDNALSWIDWSLTERNADLFRFFRLLIAFRRQHAALRRISFVPLPCCPRIEWNGVKLGQPDWSWHSRSLAMHLLRHDENGIEDRIYLIANAHWEEHKFELPAIANRFWLRFIDTTLESPEDISDQEESSFLVRENYYTVGPRSVVVLVAK